MKINKSVLGLASGFLFFLSGCGGVKNLHQIDEDPATGFAIYRSGQPKVEDAEALCEMGITKFFALNGGGHEYEAAVKAVCPQAEVVYNEMQDPDSMISAEFIRKFDQAVADAKAKGEKILFHCTCGCHRTGRLAAYYRMKYQGWSALAAIDEMNARGKNMSEHPTLPIQVRGLEQWVRGLPCTEPKAFCMDAIGT